MTNRPNPMPRGLSVADSHSVCFSWSRLVEIHNEGQSVRQNYRNAHLLTALCGKEPPRNLPRAQ